tara:strand:+ start:1059 stop:2144 length:1086 start_codon:yes stop_codon:yes gene_type:complete
MTKEQSLQKLEEIASEAGQQNTDYSLLDSQLKQHTSNVSIKKSEQLAQQVQQLYPEDRQKAFDTWNAGTQDFDLNPETKKYYWKTYENLSPDPSLYKEALTSQVKDKLRKLETTSEKEYYIRDNLNKWPNWLSSQYESSLAGLMMVNQTKDMLKGEISYKTNTLDKVNDLLENAPLSPDIREEDHVADLLKLETMGFLNAATIYNGRVGISNKEQEFQPAWSIKNAGEVSEDAMQPVPAEAAFLRDSVASDIKDLVSVKLKDSREQIREQNKEIKFIMLNEMSQGNIPMDKWGDVASMIEDPQEDGIGSLMFLFSEGIKGMIKQAERGTEEPVKDTEINDMIMLAFTKYANLFGELYNGEA